jgi:hypothetical protein
VKRAGFGLFESFQHFITLAFKVEPPIWKSCPAGCCTLGEA